ncbi:MAG: acyl-CoA synthetase [Solirubrobacteraceae bacterium]|nr:acyl-CoA synthetase [Solirubrobacteraceae bacterium]
MQLGVIGTKLHTLQQLGRTGIVQPMPPGRFVGLAMALKTYGPTPAGGYAAAAAVRGDQPGIIDELGVLTFGQIHRRTNSLANALTSRGIKAGDNVALLCRNHRGFVEATIALSKIGAHALYLNTMFAGPQIADVCAREQPSAIVYDEEFRELCSNAGDHLTQFVAWTDGDTACPEETLAELIATGDPTDVPPPENPGRIVILTSGTTGTPKGAARPQPKSLDPAASLFSKIPLKAHERTMIAAPLFHSWGLAHFFLAMSLRSTIVLRRRFDPESTLAAIAENRCTTLAVVPVMLQRILDVGPEVLAKYDTSSLRIIAASGSALPGELAVEAMNTFGDVLYNLYGSTEVAWASIATPADLRAAPGTAGRPPHGTTVRLYDDQGREVPQGQVGRIFVGNEMQFEGYTGGGGKEIIDGLMSSGDVGHFDEGGRLFIDGRDDEMIVSGGENVFPREVEDLLASHDAIHEVAVLGVADDEWGQRLVAFAVVHEDGTVTEDDMKDHVKANLARFKVPREIHFVEELPRNATGKVLKRELREQV